MAAYLAERKVVNPATKPAWRIQPVAGVAMRFDTGAGALRYLARQPQFRLAAENGDGSVSLELVE